MGAQPDGAQLHTGSTGESWPDARAKHPRGCEEGSSPPSPTAVPGAQAVGYFISLPKKPEQPTPTLTSGTRELSWSRPGNDRPGDMVIPEMTSKGSGFESRQLLQTTGTSRCEDKEGQTWHPASTPAHTRPGPLSL